MRRNLCSILVALAAIGTCVRAQDASSEQTAPIAPVVKADAYEAFSGALDQLCPWFLSGKDYSFPGTAEHAGRVGFHRGASVNYLPVGMSSEGATSALGFTYIDKAYATNRAGLAAFLAFDPTACQVQAFGYADFAAQYEASLQARGWRLVTPLTQQKNITHISYQGHLAGLDGDVKIVINRWADSKPPQNGLWAIINVVPLPPIAPKH